jgi:hypothetical protein
MSFTAQSAPSDMKPGSRRKALLIGINYFRTKAELKGCINDVKNVKAFLLQHGYIDSPQSMLILTDDNPRQQPLKRNIISACQWLVKDAVAGDRLFFHYSGHGGQQEDKNGDEADGYDETILPLDYAKEGHIVDDDLHNMLVKPLKAGVKLTAVFDSCHSGTALDLPFIYKSSGTYKEPGLSKMEIGSSLLQAGLGAVTGGASKADALKIIGSAVLGGYKAKTTDEKNMQKNHSPADVIHIAGCADDQTSADTAMDGKATGAMSFALIGTLKQNPHPTLTELLNTMRDVLAEKQFEQIPQMSTSHEMDPNSKFVF